MAAAPDAFGRPEPDARPLELGGKSTTIVCDDFDVDEAASRILHAKLLNAGHMCLAPDYLFQKGAEIVPFVPGMTFNDHLRKIPPHLVVGHHAGGDLRAAPADQDLPGRPAREKVVRAHREAADPEHRQAGEDGFNGSVQARFPADDRRDRGSERAAQHIRA